MDPQQLTRLLQAQCGVPERVKTRSCPDHPSVLAVACGLCADTRHAADLAADRDRVLTQAADACDTRFPLRYRDADADHPDVLAWLAAFRRDPRHAPSLLVMGPVGAGKTWQVYGAIRAVAAIATPVRGGTFRTPTWIARTFADFAASVRARSGSDPDAAVEAYQRTDLMVLDDLGLAKGTEWLEQETYRLLNARYEHMRPSLLTTNLAPDQLRDALGDRITSRLAETCQRVVLDGPDRRRTLPPRRGHLAAVPDVLPTAPGGAA